jgi:hypothetical protein
VPNFYAEIPQDAFDKLILLKQQIDIANTLHENTQGLLQEFDEELSDIWFWMTDPLPPECVLENVPMPSYYEEFLEIYKENGPHTLLTQCKRARIIAEVRVKKVNLRSAKLRFEEVLSFKKHDEYEKDCFGEYIKIDTSVWRPRFIANQNYLIFTINLLGAPNIPSAYFNFPIQLIGNDLLVEVPYHQCSFWKDIDLPRLIICDKIYTPYSSLVNWLLENTDQYS